LRNSCPEEKEVHKMKNIETLMKKASELKAEGLVEGQISEELNISSETTWLLTHAEKASTAPGPKDISVDWSIIGKSAFRLSHISQALSDVIYETMDSISRRGRRRRHRFERPSSGEHVANDQQQTWPFTRPQADASFVSKKVRGNLSSTSRMQG
jgi:hypothetical protein